MVMIIRNANVYAPEHLGRTDVLLLGGTIAAVGQNLKADFGGAVEVTELDGSDLVLTPGFIDSHEHIIGGGGEGGFHTRTPEASLTDLTTNGITTVVGCIGTDGVARHMESLLAKARGLEEEGPYLNRKSYEGHHDAGQGHRSRRDCHLRPPFLPAHI